VTDFTLPELGEQIESGDVLRVLVKPATPSPRNSRSSSSKPTGDHRGACLVCRHGERDQGEGRRQRSRSARRILSYEDGAAAPAANKPAEEGRKAEGERQKGKADKVDKVENVENVEEGGLDRGRTA